MQNFNWRMKKITATGQALVAGEVFGGFVTQAAGTATTLTAYDDTSAVAGNLIIPATDTTKSNIAGVFVSPFGGGVGPLTVPPPVNSGLILQNGLWVVVGGTGTPSVWVLFR